MIALSACAPGSNNTKASPTPTLMPRPTPTPLSIPTGTPLVTQTPTPVPSSLILTDFPLAAGTTWKYAAQISFQDPKDYEKMDQWTGIVTDRVVERKAMADGTIVFTLKETLEPTPPQDVWRQASTYDYTIKGDGIYKYNGRAKIFQYPLSNNLSWEWEPGFGYSTYVGSVGDYQTPYGKLGNCYSFTTPTNPDVTQDTFCRGIGFAAHHYEHHGTPQVEDFELVSYEPGQ